MTTNPVALMGNGEEWEFTYGGPKRGAPLLDHPQGPMLACGWLRVTEDEIYRLFICDTPADEFRRCSGHVWMARRRDDAWEDVTEELGVDAITTCGVIIQGIREEPEESRLRVNWRDHWDTLSRHVRGLFKWRPVRTLWYPRSYGTLPLPDIAVWEAGPDVWRLHGYILQHYLDAYDDPQVTPADFTHVDENGCPCKRHHEVGVVRELYDRYRQIDPDRMYYRDAEGIQLVEQAWPDGFWDAEQDGVRRMKQPVAKPGTPKPKFWFSGHAMAEQWIADFSKVMWAMWD